MTVTRRSVLIASTAAPAAGALLSTPAQAASARSGRRVVPLRDGWRFALVDATHTLPASVEVQVWDGSRYVPVEGTAVEWATASDTPSAITFHAVRGSRLRLTLTSAYPGEARGAVRISKLDIPAA